MSEHIILKRDTSRVVIAGDWNLTLNRIDKQGELAWKPTASRNAVVDLMDELNLIDIYWKLHPRTKSFTYESKPLKLKSGIDVILVSRPISFDVKGTEMRASIAPGHKSVFVNIEIKSEFKGGPGIWKFNNTLLEDDNYKERITFYYSQVLEKYSADENKQLIWKLIKMELRSKTIKFSKQKRRELKLIETSLQKKVTKPR